MRRVADNCYLPANKIILDLIHKYKGAFKVSFAISGTTLDQFRSYTPEVIDSFRELADTGCVEFLAETYSHSFSVFKNKAEFKRQVEAHAAAIESLFGKRPKVFTNTEFIYSDEIGAIIADMGYKAVLTEGPNQIHKWKCPNYLYSNPINPALSIFVKNYPLSADISLRFSNSAWSGWPMTAKKYASWLSKILKEEKIVNLVFDYETFGEHQKIETGIFKFMSKLPSEIFQKTDFKFVTPSDVIENYQPTSTLNVPTPISWANDERDLTDWLGNELQQWAFDKLYGLSKMIDRCDDPAILKDWRYLQTSDHFYYMNTKYFSRDDLHTNFNHYSGFYEAFEIYMNVLNNFALRLNRIAKVKNENQVLNHESNLTEV
jgi:alpha-amylase